MSLIRKSIRRRARRDRRRDADAAPSPDTRNFSVATVAIGPLAALFGEEACTCPVCQYLEKIDAPREELPDGTVVHRLTEREHLEVSALMSGMPVGV